MFVDLIEAEHFSFNIYAKVDSLLIQTAVPYMWLITWDRKWLILSSPGKLQHDPLAVRAAGAHENFREIQIFVNFMILI